MTCPCGSCKLSPCFRRGECPRHRRWERERQAQKIVQDEEKAKDGFLAEMTIRRDQRIRRRLSPWAK